MPFISWQIFMILGALCRWFKDIDRKYGNRQQQIVHSIAMLSDHKYASEQCNMIISIGGVQHKQHRKEMRCQSEPCDKEISKTRRRQRYQCSSCIVAVYCSRRSQKYDWNRNNHGELCRRLKDLRNKITWKA